jgi:2-C-methyl-D-erythritol 4-phosphate cytidylyltransferase
MNTTKINCILLGAGKAKRMGKEVPKQFLRLGGKPILIHVLETLEKSSLFNQILLTILPEAEAMYKELISNYGIKDIVLVKGGNSRQESTYNALKLVKTSRVLIHEAARPFVKEELLHELITFHDDAVVPVIPVDFTISTGDLHMTGILDREQLRNIQLPQLFNTEILKEAHEKALLENFKATEDSMLVFRLGKQVRFIKGSPENFKITTPFDLMLAEKLMYTDKDLG